MRRLILAAAAMLSLGTISHAQEEDAAPAPRTEAELTAALDQLLGDSTIPGAQIVLIENGVVSLSYNYGVSDRAAGTPVTEDTMFRAGSISKSFVGVVAMMAVEDGLISLDTPIAQAAPDIAFENAWEDTDPITLAHAMEHTAGFFDIANREYFISNPDITIVEGLAINPANRFARWRPGTYFSYANSGPPIAAHAVELARGESFDDIVRADVLRPLGMRSSDFLRTDEIANRLSLSYEPGAEAPIPYFHIIIRPSGSLSTTALELSHFVRMLIGRGEVDGVRLLTPESVARIERSETLRAAHDFGLEHAYGLGNDAIYAETAVFRGHSGAIDGFLAEYAYIADQRSGYVIMINETEGRTAQALGDMVRNYLLRDFVPNLPAPYPADEAVLDGYTGFYLPVTPRTRFEAALLAIVPPGYVSHPEPATLIVGGVDRIANGPHTMRRPERAESSFALVQFDDGTREIHFSNVAMRHVPFWRAMAGYAMPICLIAGTLLALLYEVLRLPWIALRTLLRRPAPRKRKGPAGLRVYAMLTVVALIGFGAVFFMIANAGFAEAQSTTEVSPLTLALFALSIAVPVLAALGFLAATFGKGEAGWGKRGYHAFALGLVLVSCAWFAQWGWIGVRYWTF